MTEPPTSHCLALRLAAPVQSWGSRSMFNRRDTAAEPTKSGILGLLAAAEGRRRTDSIEDLLGLTLGVRTDQPGTLLRDYHTVSDYRGRPLPSTAVNAKGAQKPTSPAKHTHLTERFYLQDAVFVAAVAAPDPVLATLADALRNPAYPLALGRRACPPTQPLLLAVDSGDDLWPGDVVDVLGRVPWQAGPQHREALIRSRRPRPAAVDLPVTVDDPTGPDVRHDLPTSFDPHERGFTSRRIRQTWVHLPPPYELDAADLAVDGAAPPHDPFALLGW
ncbi:type I-E CRISPR-associated protein Cas5/CasD [Frankia gtarii]|uniref:type I-E CRISPR-associated protein Cas5/CasD n=1 Tax=Frankia gtarii TaxID=2950102 RepID=UPI0021BF97A9|nr:type I-E CRISPR-associated protein Cas5/CasD [Frankia gtarii]